MINIKFTRHAEDRLANRLNNLVTANEIKEAVAKRFYQNGRTYLQIKKIAYTEINDETVKPDKIARGDLIVAAIDFDKKENVAQITTILLRKSWSQSEIYTKINS